MGLVRGLAKRKDPKTTLVKDILTPNVLWCNEDDDVQKAAATMSQQQVRRLVVLNKNKQIAGVISLGDIALKNKNDQMAGHTLHDVVER